MTLLVVTWSTDDAEFPAENIEGVVVEHYAPTLGGTVEATCPPPGLSEPGDWLECSISTDDGQEVIVRVTLDDLDGSVSFLLLRGGS